MCCLIQTYRHRSSATNSKYKANMDEFSFPTIAGAEQEDCSHLCGLPFPHFSRSPLWFLSSSQEPSEPAVDQEKMDRLWECFYAKESAVEGETTPSSAAVRAGISEMALVKRWVRKYHFLKLLSESNGSSSRRRPRSLALILKLMRKLI